MAALPLLAAAPAGGGRSAPRAEVGRLLVPLHQLLTAVRAAPRHDSRLVRSLSAVERLSSMRSCSRCTCLSCSPCECSSATRARDTRTTGEPAPLRGRPKHSFGRRRRTLERRGSRLCGARCHPQHALLTLTNGLRVPLGLLLHLRDSRLLTRRAGAAPGKGGGRRRVWRNFGAPRVVVAVRGARWPRATGRGWWWPRVRLGSHVHALA